MAYRPPTKNFTTPESSRPQLQKPWAPKKADEKKELTGQDFPSLGKPVSKSDSSTSLASNTSNTSESKTLSLAEKMKVKLAEEEAERKRREDEERRKKQETEADRLRQLSLGNVVTFSQISKRVAEERMKNQDYSQYDPQYDSPYDSYDRSYDSNNPQYDYAEDGFDDHEDYPAHEEYPDDDY
jgi:hypothetical protein